LTVDEVRQTLTTAAIDLGDPGPDPEYGFGRLNLPDFAINPGLCGNGKIEAGEQCDPPGGCCSATCQLLPTATVCRAKAGKCDIAETCNGTSPTCPADAKKTDVCRAKAGACDIAERCDGVSNACPADKRRPQGFVCRPSTGVCDPQEVCSGTDTQCPADTPLPPVCGDGCVESGEQCDGASGVCSAGGTCDLEACACAPSQDLIFKDGFESGDLSVWSASATDNGDLLVAADAALVGSRGLKLIVDDTNPLWVRDDSPNGESRYRARFYVKPSSLTLANGTKVKLLNATQDSLLRKLVTLTLRHQGAKYQIMAQVRQDDESVVKTNWLKLRNAGSTVEFEWRKPSGTDAHDGKLRLWIDQVLVATLTGIDNDVGGVDSVQLGILGGLAASSSGTLYIDHFESRRVNFIGP
jgi:hypothetical protein